MPYVDGLRGSLAAVENPSYVAVLANNDTVFSDAAHSVVRSVSYGTGIVGRVAGVPGVPGFKEGPALTALMSSPAGLCSMSTTAVPLGDLYIAGEGPGYQRGDAARVDLSLACTAPPADTANNVIWVFSPVTGNLTILAGTGAFNATPFPSDQAWPATSIAVPAPTAMTCDSIYGAVYAIVAHNQVVQLAIFASPPTVRLFAGVGGAAGRSPDSTPAYFAFFANPLGIFINSRAFPHVLYIVGESRGTCRCRIRRFHSHFCFADTGNCKIRSLNADLGNPGYLFSFAGTGECTFAGDGRPPIQTHLSYPVSMVVSASGDAFISEEGGRVRRAANTGLSPNNGDYMAMTTVVVSPASAAAGWQAPRGLATLSVSNTLVVATGNTNRIVSVSFDEASNSSALRFGLGTVVGSGIPGNTNPGDPTLVSTRQVVGLARASYGEFVRTILFFSDAGAVGHNCRQRNSLRVRGA